MRRGVLSVLVLVLLLSGCEERPRETVIDYFWPLQEGRVFVYETNDASTHSVHLKHIEHRSDGTILVATTQARSGTSQAEGSSEMAYELIPKEDVVYLVEPFGKQSERAVLLKGPIGKGNAWTSEFLMTGPKDAVVKTIMIKASGPCGTKDAGTRLVLGTEVSCISCACRMESEGLSVYDEHTYCRGIGGIGGKVVVTYKRSGQQPFTWEERLVAAR